MKLIQNVRSVHTRRYFFPGSEQLASPGENGQPRSEVKFRPNLFNFELFKVSMQDGRVLVDKYLTIERVKASQTLERMMQDLHTKIEAATGVRKENSGIVQQKLKSIEEQLEQVVARLPPLPPTYLSVP